MFLGKGNFFKKEIISKRCNKRSRKKERKRESERERKRENMGRWGWGEGEMGGNGGIKRFDKKDSAYGFRVLYNVSPLRPSLFLPRYNYGYISI